MPRNKKAVKRFLGCAGFFQPFVPKYSTIVAPLHDMTKDNFSWDDSGWSVDYVKVFEAFKEALKDSATLYYPDYLLRWFLRGDASEFGVGIVLLQEFIDALGNAVMQPILFASKKFSEQARKWSTYAQEAFAMFFAFKSAEYYIRGKLFVYQGDHANLAWMERSTEAKVIRWRLYMQNFPMEYFQHISGSKNEVSDWQSRFEELCEVDISDFEHELSWVESDSVWNVCHNNVSPVITSPVSSVNAVTRSATRSSIPTEPVKTDTLLPFVPNTESPRLLDISDTVELSLVETPVASERMTRNDMLTEAHCGRAGHLGIRRTYALLNESFPGHGISLSQVREFKERCPVCQKTEDYMSVQLVPVTRHLKTSDPGKVVGMDYLTVCPDRFGNVGAHILRDHFTKLIYIHPTRNHDAESAALAIFLYCVIYGGFDILMTDPGSDYMSQAVEQVNKWFGIHHRVSLVDRHESNGVEGANKQALRHLSKLFMTERIKEEWSSPHNVGWASFIVNKYDVSESGYSPYDLTFGTHSRRRFDLPTNQLDSKQVHEYIRLLDNSLKSLTDSARRYQQDLAAKRVSKDRPQNCYQKGDLVLLRLPRDKPRPHKLHPIYLGPYKVLAQTKNDVEAQHMATGAIRSIYVADLKAFFGSHDEARQLASVDADQFLVTQISAYRGDPFIRSSMYFLVEYADGDILWIPWSLDIQNSEAYHLFCESVPALRPLLLPSAKVAKWCRDLRKTPIQRVNPHQKVLVDIRAFGSDWYATLTLPDKDTITFLAPCTYGSVSPNRRTIHLLCPLLQLDLLVDNVFVHLYGDVPPPDNHQLVDKALVNSHPSLLTTSTPVLPSPSDFEHLVGKTFYDTDARSTFTVTRISVTRTNDIVAYVRPTRHDGRSSRESERPYHVADVLDLVPV